MILLLGASGCTGSYLLETLLNETDLEVIAWVRDPSRLRIRKHPRLQIWNGGLEALDAYRPALTQVTALLHTATIWGGPDTFVINQRQTWKLFQALDLQRCRQIHLLSTASLLNSAQEVWPQALQLGTDYIRSKAALHQQILSSDLPVSLYYPTVILGGDTHHPYTAVSAALPDVPRWLNWVRWLQADGSLHLIHARDIARILVYRLVHQLPPQHLVLGNPALSVDQLIAALCRVYGYTLPAQRLPLPPFLPPLVQLLRPWMSSWDRFSLAQRHTVYSSVHARSYGLPEDLMDLEQMLKSSGLITQSQ